MLIPQKIQDLAKKVREAIFGKDVREAIAESMEVTGQTAAEARQITEQLLDESYDVSLLNTEIERRMDSLYTTKGKKMDDLHDEKRLSLESLEQEYADKAEVLETTYAPRLTRVEGGLEETNAQLAQTTQKLVDRGVNPDDFEGTDFEKIQQAINKAITEKKGVILTRIYDVTNTQPIMIDNSPGRWTLEFHGIGGGFKKTNSGFLFSSNDNMSADINFNSVKFQSIAGSGTVVFNADKLLIINTNMCTFEGVDHYATTTKYMQSYRSIGDRVTGGSGYFIITPSVFDLVVENILVEVRESFFLQTVPPDGSAWVRLYNARFDNCVIEGLTGTAFSIRRAEVLKIDGAYFEMNKVGNIVFASDSILDNVFISNIRLYESPSAAPPLPLIKWGGVVNSAKTFNNRSNNAPVHDTTNVESGRILSELDYSGNNAKNNIDPNNRIMLTGGYPRVNVESGVNIGTHGVVRKLNKTNSIQLAISSLPQKVQVEFNEEIYRDDIISIQTYSSNQSYAVDHFLRNSTNKKIVDIHITNRANGELNVTLDVTILKLNGLTTQRG